MFSLLNQPRVIRLSGILCMWQCFKNIKKFIMKQPFFCSLPRSETFLLKLTLRFGTEYAFHKNNVMWRGCNCRKKCQMPTTSSKKSIHSSTSSIFWQSSTSVVLNHRESIPPTVLRQLCLRQWILAAFFGAWHLVYSAKVGHILSERNYPSQA